MKRLACSSSRSSLAPDFAGAPERVLCGASSTRRRLKDEEAEEGGVTQRAVAGRVGLGDHSQPVAVAEEDDGAVAERVDAVPVGRRAVDAQHAGVVALHGQAERGVRLRAAAHVHVVVAGHRHRHLVARAAPARAADRQHVGAVELQRTQSAAAGRPVRVPVDRPRRRAAVAGVVMERGERQQRLLEGRIRTGRHLPDFEFDRHLVTALAVHHELAGEGRHAGRRRRHSHQLADAETVIGQLQSRRDTGRNCRRHAEEIRSLRRAEVDVAGAVESERIRTHAWLLKRNLHMHAVKVNCGPCLSCRNKNSSGDEIANVNFYAVRPGSYANSLK